MRRKLNISIHGEEGLTTANEGGICESLPGGGIFLRNLPKVELFPLFNICRTN